MKDRLSAHRLVIRVQLTVLSTVSLYCSVHLGGDKDNSVNTCMSVTGVKAHDTYRQDQEARPYTQDFSSFQQTIRSNEISLTVFSEM